MNGQKKTNTSIALLPLIAGVLWGTAGIFVRTLTEHGMSAMTIIEARVCIATVFLGIIIFIKDRSMLRMKLKDVPLVMGAAFIGTFGLNVCYNISINQLTLSLSAVLLGLNPVFVVLMAAPLFKERITLRKGLCTFAALAGCVLVSGLLETGTAIRWTPFGIFIGVLSGFFYALYSIFSRLAMDRGYHALTITFFCFLFISITLLPVTNWGQIGGMVAEAPLKNSLFLFAHSLCMTILPYLFYNIGLAYMEAGMVSVLASAEPAAAMVFGALVYSEMPSFLSLLGLVIVLAALGVLSLTKESADPPEEG